MEKQTYREKQAVRAKALRQLLTQKQKDDIKKAFDHFDQKGEGSIKKKELKVAYSEIDNFLLGKQVTQKAEKQINFLHNISAHKRNLINLPLPYKKIK